MIFNFFKKTGLQLSDLSKPFVQWLAVIFLPCFFTLGCGSDNEIPGAANPGDKDPLANGTSVFFVQRALPTDEMGALLEDQLSNPTEFIGNGRLFMKIQAHQEAEEIIISDRVYSGNYDVRDIDVSHEGRYVLFSMRAPQLADTEEENQPSWNIWEYDTRDDTLRQVISDPLLAEKGHDIMARYLPGTEGDIVFASTRQQKSRAILLDEGKSGFTAQEETLQGPTLNLHVMSRSGSDIAQITFNMSHDTFPTVVSDGSIIYSRWDRFTHNNFNLYQINPDGTNNRLIYGHHSHNTGANNSEFQFVKPSFTPDGELFVLARPFSTSRYGGDFITIDVDNYIDNTQPVPLSNGSGPAQASITHSSVETDTNLSPGGYYAAYFALRDGTDRVLTSWSQCLVRIGANTLPCSDDNLNDPQARTVDPSYGIWVMNPVENTQIPIMSPEPGFIYTDIILAAEREYPDLYAGALDGKADAATLTNMRSASVEEAILHIRSVYDLDGEIDLDFDGDTSDHTATDYANLSNPTTTAADQRPARFLKVVKGVPEPDGDVKTPAAGSFGVAGAQRMKEIIGYAPIEPDGSVKVRVPANIPFMISVTDRYGKRLTPRHQNWITLAPGEVMECNGCHRRDSENPHGRLDAQIDSINPGQPVGFPYAGADPALVSPYLNGTMAETKAFELEQGTANDIARMKLSQNLIYDDYWDPVVTAPDLAEFPLRYQDMPSFADLASEPGTNCEPWNGRCRIRIHYEDHIQPLWEYDRSTAPQINASDGQPATCVRCHSRTDAASMPQIPAGQLELTGEVDGNNGVQNRSYVDLFFDDVELVDDGMGGVTDCTVEVPAVDADGNPILDAMGNPTTVFVLCAPTETASMSANGALASRFFDVFAAGGSHQDYLTADELRLIAEWLDIGGQYYNDHFAAPDN